MTRVTSVTVAGLWPEGKLDKIDTCVFVPALSPDLPMLVVVVSMLSTSQTLCLILPKASMRRACSYCSQFAIGDRHVDVWFGFSL
jgi:hypothetical protein